MLLKALLKMIWDVHTDQGSTPEPVRAALLQRATECLILLDRCSEGQVKVSWGPSKNLSLLLHLKKKKSMVYLRAHPFLKPNSISTHPVSTWLN